MFSLLQVVFEKETNRIVSGGNFHGEYPAKACDYLAIGVHEFASVSERRIERLVNTSLNGHLPPFLVRNGGLNSGFMMAHVTAASLVSENKVERKSSCYYLILFFFAKGLCHPSSIDTIPTSAGQEDHVSMGGWAARKALRVVENVEYVLAIEILSACQALEFLRPLKVSIDTLFAVCLLILCQVHQTDRSCVQSCERARGAVGSRQVYESRHEQSR